MNNLLFTVLKYDGQYLSEEIRIYESSDKVFQIPRLEILHGVVRGSNAGSPSKKLENVSPAAKKRSQQKRSRQNHKRKQKEISKA